MATHMDRRSARANYGVDAPALMVGFLLGGAAAAITGGVATRLAPGAWRWLGVALMVLGAAPLFFGVLMTAYWLVGKRRTREHMLNLVEWRGDEAVLDVGTGAGFMMVGAAKRAPRGRVVGVDAWSAKDLSNNSGTVTLSNAALEDVADRCEVVTGDARDLAWPDASFDCVLSLLCLHNIEPKADRARACREIARVLKPGGRVVIGDYVPTHDYASALWNAGLRIRRSQAAFSTALSLMWILVADKPA